MQMKFPTTLFSSLTLTLTLCILSLPSWSAGKELKFTTALPEKSPSAKQVTRMISTVTDKAGGTIDIVPYFSSQLGGETAALSQVARGRIEMGQFTLASASLQVPELALAQLPLFFDTTEQRDCVLDEHLFEPVSELLAKKNLTLLRWGEVGALHLAGQVSYADPEALKGVKIGMISHKISNVFWKIMGANPISTNVAEIASSLQTGLIDTYPIPYVIYVPTGINKIAPTMTNIKLWDSAGVWVMNKRVYDRLPDEAKKAFAEERTMHPDSLLREEVRQLDAHLTELHKQQGGTVVIPSDEQRAQWRAKLTDFYKNMAADLGPDGEAFFAILEAGKKACANQ